MSAGCCRVVASWDLPRWEYSGLTPLMIDKSRHVPGAFAEGGSLVEVKVGHHPNFCSTRLPACYSLR
jgi:hypothetical protein